MAVAKGRGIVWDGLLWAERHLFAQMDATCKVTLGYCARALRDEGWEELTRRVKWEKDEDQKSLGTPLSIFCGGQFGFNQATLHPFCEAQTDVICVQKFLPMSCAMYLIPGIQQYCCVCQNTLVWNEDLTHYRSVGRLWNINISWVYPTPHKCKFHLVPHLINCGIVMLDKIALRSHSTILVLAICCFSPKFLISHTCVPHNSWCWPVVQS